MTKLIETKVPSELAARAGAFVAEGWAADWNELVAEAFRRFLHSRSDQLAETFVKEDVQWSLHGCE